MFLNPSYQTIKIDAGDASLACGEYKLDFGAHCEKESALLVARGTSACCESDEAALCTNKHAGCNARRERAHTREVAKEKMGRRCPRTSLS